MKTFCRIHAVETDPPLGGFYPQAAGIQGAFIPDWDQYLEFPLRNQPSELSFEKQLEAHGVLVYGYIGTEVSIDAAGTRMVHGYKVRRETWMQSVLVQGSSDDYIVNFDSRAFTFPESIKFKDSEWDLFNIYYEAMYCGIHLMNNPYWRTFVRLNPWAKNITRCMEIISRIITEHSFEMFAVYKKFNIILSNTLKCQGDLDTDTHLVIWLQGYHHLIVPRLMVPYLIMPAITTL